MFHGGQGEEGGVGQGSGAMARWLLRDVVAWVCVEFGGAGSASGALGQWGMCGHAISGGGLDKVVSVWRSHRVLCGGVCDPRGCAAVWGAV